MSKQSLKSSIGEKFQNISREHLLILIGILAEIALAFLLSYITSLSIFAPSKTLESIWSNLFASTIGLLIGIIIIIIMLIIFVWMAIKYIKQSNTIYNKTKNCLDDLSTKDITMSKVIKKITINDASLNDGYCELKHIFQITNHMEKTYKHYILDIVSSEGVSKKDDIEICKDVKYVKMELFLI